MKYYSSETMRGHAQDLANELEVKQIEDTLRYFMVNEDKGKTAFPMYDLGSRHAREWASIGVLDLHDLAQECYCALSKAHNRIKWDVINASSSPKASLWAYLKKSVKLDVRKAINTYKDGMRIPLDKIWEVKVKKKEFDQTNFFTVPYPQMWFWTNDDGDLLKEFSTEKVGRYDVERLGEALKEITLSKLSPVEMQVIEMSFGIDQYPDRPKTYREMENHFNLKGSNLRKIKQRALEKLRTKEIEKYLENYYDFESQIDINAAY